jgi:hypothetical protein
VLYAAVSAGLIVAGQYEERHACGDEGQFGCGVFVYAVFLALPATVVAVTLVLGSLPIRDGRVRTGVRLIGGLLLGLPLALGTIGLVVALFGS